MAYGSKDRNAVGVVPTNVRLRYQHSGIDGEVRRPTVSLSKAGLNVALARSSHNRQDCKSGLLQDTTNHRKLIGLCRYMIADVKIVQRTETLAQEGKLKNSVGLMRQ